jgi:hypothetical protein
VTRRGWIAGAVFFALTVPAVTTRIYASDEIQYFAYLRSLWFDRDVSFENEYRYFYDSGTAKNPGFRETFLERRTETGRRINFATIGCAILWAPFYAIADAAVQIARLLGSEVPSDGYARPYVAAVCYASALYGALAIALSMWIAHQVVGAGAVAGALAVWAGTPLIFYMYVAPPMSHATSAFAVSLFLAAWLVVRRTWTPAGAALLGALAALMGMVREQDLFFAIGPVVDGAIRHGVRPHAWRVRASVAFLVAFALAYAPQLLAYQSLNGRPGPSQLVERKMTWTAPHFLQVLASPEHGLIAWTPLALAAIAGLTLLAVRPRRPDERRIAALALLMLAVQIYIAGSVESWTVAGAYGQRRFVSLTPLLVLGVAALWRAAARRRSLRVALTGAVGLAVWWNVGLMVQFGAGTMDRQRLELSRNAYNTFVAVPGSLPQLMYRYLFDRSSFYQQPGPPR